MMPPASAPSPTNHQRHQNQSTAIPWEAPYVNFTLWSIDLTMQKWSYTTHRSRRFRVIFGLCVVRLLTITASFSAKTEALVSIIVPSFTNRQCSTFSSSCLFARGRKSRSTDSKKRATAKSPKSTEQEVPRRRVSSGGPGNESDGAARQQPTTRKVSFSIPLSSNYNDTNPTQSLPLVIYQVNDPKWWQERDPTACGDKSSSQNAVNGKNNPFGARVWPSSLAVAEFLVNQAIPTTVAFEQQSTSPPTTSRSSTIPVMELGCGPGIPSLAVATAFAESHVIATDVSPVALQLLNEGWAATKRAKQKQQRRLSERSTTVGEEVVPSKPNNEVGSLIPRPFDVFSDATLPLQKAEKVGTSHPSIVIACTMMYDARLAEQLAIRVVEAIRDFNAWIILGDDDTGERDRGRSLFWSTMRAEFPGMDDIAALIGTTPTLTIPPSKSVPFSLSLDRKVVRNEKLGWQGKEVHIIQLNSPIGDFKESEYAIS